MRRSAVLSLLPLLAVTACATEPSGGQRFGIGDPDELVVAYDLGTAALESGVLAQRGVVDTTVLDVKVDAADHAHVKVQQWFDGVPVFGGEAIVHLDPNGQVVGTTDDLVEAVSVDTTPDYTADEAVAIAVAELRDVPTREPEVALMVLRRDDGDHLVWRVQLTHLAGDDHDTRPVTFIDAHDGEIVWAYENLQTATCSGSTNFYGTVSVDCLLSGTSYYLEDSTDLVGTYSYGNTTTSLSYVSSTSTTFGTTTAVKNAVEAHYVAGKVMDFYATAYARDGIDGAGGPGAVTSHGYDFIASGTSYSRGYVNAYWDGSMMTYGDGDGVNSGSLTTLDIGGHEFTHGVTENEANLVYSGEPGHLNEAISDIFGAMVERSVSGESADTWMIGEATWTPGTSGDALRYMNDPADDGYSYDYYTSAIGTADVHYGSGVPNLVFYLMSEGGTHPRGKSTTSVTAIGADDAAAIWYLALSSYMTSTTNFSGARTAMLSAATSLYGASSAQYAAVNDAWSAVGVGSTSTPTCTTATYTGSLAKARASAYAPSSSGTSVTSTAQTVSLSAASGTDFDLYLQKRSGSRWTNVASSATTGSAEAISYTGTSGTYRVLVYSYAGKGSYTVNWCK